MADSRTRVGFCTIPCVIAAMFAVSGVAEVSWAACGDGVVEAPGEQCDDGNVADGDCCSSACGFEADGTPCNSSDLCFSAAAATCDGAGLCLARNICFADYDAYTLVIVDSATKATERAHWKQGRVSADLLPLGDPTTTTRYGWCAYATADVEFFPSEGSVVFSREIAPGPQWSATLGDIGWTFRGDRNTPGGVRLVSIGGREGRLGSFARFRAASVDGVGLPGPVDADSYFNVGPSVGGVVVGLVNDAGLCLLSAIPSYPGSVVENTPTRFKAHLGFLD